MPKIVIDIPDDYYKVLMNIPDWQCDADTLLIQNGTSLEKVLEDIKTEIESKKQYRDKSGNPVIDAHDIGLDRYFDKGLDMALSTIDKHISRRENE